MNSKRTLSLFFPRLLLLLGSQGQKSWALAAECKATTIKFWPLFRGAGRGESFGERNPLLMSLLKTSSAVSAQALPEGCKIQEAADTMCKETSSHAKCPSSPQAQGPLYHFMEKVQQKHPDANCYLYCRPSQPSPPQCSLQNVQLLYASPAQQPGKIDQVAVIFTTAHMCYCHVFSLLDREPVY